MKLHLACGNNYIPGFIHVDIRPNEIVNYVCSVDNLNMFKDNSVELIYASHILEHFGRRSTQRVLFEWRRVLQPGGTLRVSVPDFDQAVKMYLEHHDMEMIQGQLVGGQTYDHNYHHVVFNFNTLKENMEKVGFKDVRRYDWKKTIHKDYDDYSQSYIPHMDKENGINLSLNVECTK